jgi:hypothetical protein
MTVLFSACGGGGNGSDNPSGGALTTGNWSGSGVSFTLIEGSYWISDLSVTYSGSATGTICSFNYTKTETMGTDILVELDAVTNNWIFSYDSPDSPFLDLADLTIEGVFTSGTSAELELTWSFYDDVCDVTVTGSDVLYADHGDGPSPPVAGDWSGTSGFGEIELVVSPDSTAIETIVIRYIDFTCGNVTSNGSITITSSWPISSGQFSADLNLDIAENRTMKITGTFDDSGTYVSGTYEADYDGILCDGTWDASPEL